MTEMLSEESREESSISPTELSDEILLHILSYIPSTDLILNVRRVCRKLESLCLDKSLIQRVLLRKEYQASDEHVKQLLREIGREIHVLDMSGCYWLSSLTIDHVTRCKNLVKLSLSGCNLTSIRLSKMLSDLQNLRSLAIDVYPGFDAGQLSSECKATLSCVLELKQTLFTPSYGVVPCCTSLEKLLLYFEIFDRTRDGDLMSGQLMVGESNVPHYQNLRLFYARLAPGYVNQEVVRLYLAVLSDRTPENLRAFLISVPGSLAESGAIKNLLDCMARNVSLDALQLPKSWINGSSLLQNMKFSQPFYFSFSRCMLSGRQLIQRVINGGKDLRSLVSLNLSGCIHCLALDSLFRKAEDDIDSSVLETLVASCPKLKHLNLSAAHHHSSESMGKHLCQLLSRLGHLRSLSLPVCAVVDATRNADKLPSQTAATVVPCGFGKKVRIGVQSYPRNVSEQENVKLSSVFWKFLEKSLFLENLELLGSNFSSAMPRNEPAIRNSLPPCGRSQQVGDAELAAISQLTFLRNLSLAQLPGVLTGSGLISIGLKCQQLQTLSLANLGMMGNVVYMSALCEMLKHCKQLKDLRLEQPYFTANSQFFQALSQCCSLQRLCMVSRSGSLQPDAVMAFMASCHKVVVCHMFTNDTLSACRNLQQSILRSFQVHRPALNVVIFPLLHEGLTDVIRDVPIMHLDEITLFKSRVAEEPPNLWW
ncbi:F-box/LRR-repeat protein 18-like [Rhinatrema bivittatum]|uniref:F-box/LRR-repeat protein 18 n=1 Tax=Rhinatrema bivittatum TaxID=194408 RepID=UPI0011281681|nr:F-box/LRR-repeat protein 18 [Rhinatrema bivittatum]XP_029442468.1 F-box/LRR-repeat protein 18-like [Rhinatrema bivittatum]